MSAKELSYAQTKHKPILLSVSSDLFPLSCQDSNRCLTSGKTTVSLSSSLSRCICLLSPRLKGNLIDNLVLRLYLFHVPPCCQPCRYIWQRGFVRGLTTCRVWTHSQQCTRAELAGRTEGQDMLSKGGLEEDWRTYQTPVSAQ